MAGTFLLILAAVSLFSLNFGGLLYFWFGKRVRQRREGFRKASLWLLGLHFAAILFAIVWAAVWGAEGIEVGALWARWQRPALWLVYALGVPMLFLLGLPFWWLWQDSYRAAPASHVG